MNFSRIDVLKTRTVVVNWRMFKSHLESRFTFLPRGESEFVFDYNGIAKTLHSLTPNMSVDDSIQKVTQAVLVSVFQACWSCLSIASYWIRYHLAEGHGLHIAIQIVRDSWITLWPDFSEWEDHLHLYAFLPFLKIVGPLTRRYFKLLIFTCLISSSLFWPLACVRFACVHS